MTARRVSPVPTLVRRHDAELLAVKISPARPTMIALSPVLVTARPLLNLPSIAARVQVLPSGEASVTPLSPTTTKEPATTPAPFSAVVTPEVARVHVVPSVERRITPPAPAATNAPLL